MYVVVSSGSMVTSESADIGFAPFDKIYKLPDGQFTYRDNTFYDPDGNVLPAEDVTDQYVNLMQFAEQTKLTVGTSITLQLPAGSYELYFQNQLAASFELSNNASKTFQFLQPGKYKLMLTDRPHTAVVFRVYTPAVVVE